MKEGINLIMAIQIYTPDDIRLHNLALSFN
jgi:hypothetical protein